MGRIALEPGEIGEPWIPQNQPGKGEVVAKVHYRDHSGVRRMAQGTSTSREGARKAARRRAEQRLAVRGAGRITSEMTIADLAAAWIEHKRHSVARGRGADGKPVRAKTIGQYRQTLDHQVVPRLGALRLSQVTPSALHSYFDDLRRASLSPGQSRSVLTGMLGWAVRMGALAVDPMVSQDRPSTTREVQILEPEQVPVFLAAMQASARRLPGRGGRTPTRDLLEMTTLILGTGLRSGEAHGLLWEQLALTTSPPTLTVTGTYVEADYVEVMAAYRQPHGKTAAAHRTLALPAEVVAMLSARRKRTRWRRQSDYVFAAEATGAALWPTNTRTKLGKALATHAPELGRVTLHTLRRTYGTVIARAFGSAYAQWALGHASTATTEGYYIAPPTVAPDARAVLDGLLTMPPAEDNDDPDQGPSEGQSVV